MQYDVYDNKAFEANLGQFIYACDDFDSGMYKRSKADAVECRYLDPNSKNRVWAMVFDIDRPQAAVAWKDAMMPEPNWVSQNPKNAHAHLGYALSVPVSRSIISRQWPQVFMASVEHAMSTALGADPAYGHRLTKNPLHSTHRTFYGRRDAYDLEELRSYLPAKLPRVRHRGEAIGEGRNVLLFTDLRHWAYRARFQYSNYEAWLSGCLEKANSMNGQFQASLPLSEVRATARSVAKWTWKHMSPAKFAEVQARRSSKGLIIRQSNQMDLTYEIMKDIL
ncbi:replication initiation protein [Rhodanobacter sp. FW106-PBR-R2A-1-13]|uniref:replication initiation protein n=1 Tax=Rhodanobacter sp. FW106-PBR-R2A-1-13 TaxID=3454845 RepID=UPI0034E49695